MEVAGLLLSLTGPFQQLIDSINNLETRLNAYSASHKEAVSLHRNFDRLGTNIRNLAQSVHDNAYSFPEENHNVLKEAVKNLETTVSDALEEVQVLTNRLTSKSYRFRHAFRTQAFFATLHESAHRVESLFLQISCTIANAATCVNHADRVMQTVRDFSSSHQTPSQDVFRLVVVVPENPPYVVLNYDVKDDEERPCTMEGKFKAEILREQPTSFVGAVASGTSGVGKSCALRGLAKQVDVLDKFSGGIFYHSMGLSATTTILKEKICHFVECSGGVILAHELRAEADLEMFITKARLWFGTRPVLFLLDDVWQVNDIHSDILSTIAGLVAGHAFSRMAYATRDQRLALQGRTIQFDFREERDSRTILLGISRFAEHELLVPTAQMAVENVLRVCAGLPAALAVAGNNVRLWANVCLNQRTEAWPRYWSQLDAKRSQLLSSSSGGYCALVVALSTSLDFLDNHHRPYLSSKTPFSFREMFRAFSAIRKQTWVSEHILQKLWDLPDVLTVGEVLMEMSSASVIQTEMKADGVSHNLALVARLHDLYHDIAFEEALKKQETSFWSERLLNRCASDLGIRNENADSLQLVNWCSQLVLGNQFLQGNLARLLVQSKHKDELFEVLCNPQWSIGRLEAGQGISLQDDFELCIKSFSTPGSSGDDVSRVRALKAILSAIRLSAGTLSRNSQEVRFQLSSRLMRVASEIDLVHEFVLRLKHAAGSPYMESLTPCLAGPGDAVKCVIPLGALPTCLAILDSELMACGCADGRLRIVDTERGLVVEEWRAFDKAVNLLDVSKNGRRLVCGGKDGVVNVWDIQRGLPTSLIFSTCVKHLSSVTISPDGKHVVAGANNSEWFDDYRFEDPRMPTIGLSQVWAWDIDKKDVISKPTADKPFSVHDVSFSEDGALLLILGEDTQGWVDGFFHGKAATRTFNLQGYYVFSSPCGSWGGAKAACTTPDGRFIVSESKQGCMSVLETSSGNKMCEPFQVRSYENNPKIASSHGAKRVASMDGRVIRMWDACSQVEIGNGLKGHSGQITSVKFTDRGDVVSCSHDGTLRIWDSEVPESSQISAHQAPVVSLSVIPNEQLLLSGCCKNSMCTWDLQTGEVLQALPLSRLHGTLATLGNTRYGYGSDTKQILNTDGTHIVHLSIEGKVRYWDRNLIDTGAVQLLASLISSIVFIDKDMIAMGSCTGDVRICCIPNYREEHVLMQGGGQLAKRIAAREGYSVESVDSLFVTKDKGRLVSVNGLTRDIDQEEAAELFPKDEFIPEFIQIKKYCILLWDLISYECVKAIEQGPYHLYQDYYWELPQDVVMDLVDEIFKDSIAERQLRVNGYSVEETCGSRQRKLATMESVITCSAYSKEADCVVLGLDSGEVAFLRMVDDGQESQSTLNEDQL